jgi:hypothetical protein
LLLSSPSTKTFVVRSSQFAVRSSPFAVRRSPLAVHRSAFTAAVRGLEFGVLAAKRDASHTRLRSVPLEGPKPFAVHRSAIATFLHPSACGIGS